MQVLDTWLRPSKWSRGDYLNMVFNGMMAPNPYFRLVMSLIYKTEISGISKLWFPDYSVFREYVDRKTGRRVSFDMGILEGDDVPYLYHNAVDAISNQMALFSNRNYPRYPKITFQSLCACS